MTGDIDRTIDETPAQPGYRRIKGRLWRISDPAIPETLRQALVNELMAARRAVKTARGQDDTAAERAARRRVQDAKVALGERGPRWWLPCDDATLGPRVDATLRALLRQRRCDASLCPSEVARVVDGDAWRTRMSLVRERAAALAGAGTLRITQRGEDVNGEARGPIRLARGAAFPDPG